jgi:uncharacterized membrane protein
MTERPGPSSPSGPPADRRPRRMVAAHAAGPTLTIWIYDSALGAAAGEVRLRKLQERTALQVHDEVTITWMPGAHQPRIGHLRHETSATATRDSVLGGLVGLMFLAPETGQGGADLAALAHRLRGTGIDQPFLEEVKGHLRPESSALLVLSGHADLDEVRPVIERGLARGDVVLMHALLQDTAREILHAAVRELQNQSRVESSRPLANP